MRCRGCSAGREGRGEQDHAVRGRRERERKSAEAATTTIGLRRRGEEVNGEAVGVLTCWSCSYRSNNYIKDSCIYQERASVANHQI